MFYGEVFKALNKAKVKYVVAGGTAVILHGYKRLTEDLDLIIFLEEENCDKLFRALKSVGYIPKVPVTVEQFKDKEQRKKWQKEKGMIVFSFVQKDPPFNLIDIFVEYPLRFDLVYENRLNIKIENIIIPTVSIEHLIKIKQKAGRPVDLNDIAQLKEIARIHQKERK